jgi:uncharacterized protein YjeT (DUF2065 family)
MVEYFLTALALVLVIEGLLPALNPNAFRRTMQTISGMDDRFLRIWGLMSMTIGAVLLYFFKG